MDRDRRQFLDELLETPSPSGFEGPGQRVWLDYVEPYADRVETDAYGNSVAVHEGGASETSVALAGHGDEIGLMVRAVTDEGFVELSRIGGTDRTVTRGQHVTIHAADGPVPGVVGQHAIHLRDGDEEVPEVTEQFVDVGAEDGEAARELVEVGDPITVATTVQELAGDRVAARAMDDRTGTWTAAEGFRRAVEADAEATVYAVSTVQEEVGLRGAEMVGFDLDPDVVVATDVTHAVDYPGAPGDKVSPVELGGGPVIARGTQNHPVLVEAARDLADDADMEVQLAASGGPGGTDAVRFYTARGGTPTLDLGVPNRYMHTPVEVVDLTDLEAIAELMGRLAATVDEHGPFRVDV
jgi:endoglucanase